MMDLFEWAQTNRNGNESSSITARDAANEAIDRVARNADSVWLHWANKAVARASLDGHFTTDDVWDWLDTWGVDAPHEPRALGAVMRNFARSNRITTTGEYVKSTRIECHGRPVAVWRLIVTHPERQD